MKRSGSSPAGWRYAFVFETWRTGTAGGANGSRHTGIPVNERAPSVTPVIGVLAGDRLAALGLSPFTWWYWRASFQADSTASEPPR